MAKHKITLLASTAVACLLALSACTNTPGTTDPTDPTNTNPASDGAMAPTLAETSWMNKLPQSYIDSGVIQAATTDGMAPWAFLDPTTREASGADVDLVNEAARRLGLTVEWADIQFAAAIPGVEAGRYDLYVSAMADRIDRQEVVNFIDYSSEGSGVIVPAGNPNNIQAFSDFCGLRVNILTGSMFPPLIEELNDGDCKDNLVSMTESADKQATYLAVASGQADIALDTYGVSNYTFNVSEQGKNLGLELAPLPPFAPAHQGIAFAQNNTDFMMAMAGAMQEMLEDGTYQEIFDKWAVGKLVMKQFSINTVIVAGIMDFLEI